MANGGHISCVSCTYSRLKPGKCDIWGIEISGLLLCRAFRFPGQSHTAARKDFKMLNKLKPGFVFAIDNSVVAIGNPEPIYKIAQLSNVKENMPMVELSRETIIRDRLSKMIAFALRRREFLENKPTDWSEDWYIRIGGNGFRAVSVNDATPLKGFSNKGASGNFEAIKKIFEDGIPQIPGKPVPERSLQSWLIKQALRHKGELKNVLGLDNGGYKHLFFALDEVSLGDKGHKPIIRCDIVAVGIDLQGKAFPVIIELKSSRAQTDLMRQLDGFSAEMKTYSSEFFELLEKCVGIKLDTMQARKMVIWPKSQKDNRKTEETIKTYNRNKIDVLQYKKCDSTYVMERFLCDL